MDFFEEDMKKHFNQSSSDIPEGYDWDDMKGPIFQKMPSTSGTTSTPKWHQSLWPWVMAIPVFIAATWLGYHTLQPSQPELTSPDDLVATESLELATEAVDSDQIKLPMPSADRQTTMIETTERQPSTSADNATAQQEVQQIKPLSQTTSTKIATKAASQSQKATTQSLSPTTAKERTASNTKDNTPLATATDAISTTGRSEEQLLTDSPKQLTSLEQKADLPSSNEQVQVDRPQSNENKTNQIIPLPSLPTRFDGTSVESFGEETLSEAPEYSGDNRPSPTWVLYLNGGGNDWKLSYGGEPDFAQLRNESTHTGRGLSLDGTLSRRWANGIYLYAGIGADRLEQRFDFVQVIDTNVWLRDALVATYTAPLSERRINVHRDTLVAAVSTKSVLHYNYIRLYSFRLGAGKEWLVNRWLINTDVGLGYHLIRAGNGRSVNVGERLMTYNEDNSIYQKSSWSVSGGLGIYHQLTERWSLGIQSRFSTHIRNWSREEDVSTKVRIGHLGMGLRYQLGR